MLLKLHGSKILLFCKKLNEINQQMDQAVRAERNEFCIFNYHALTYSLCRWCCAYTSISKERRHAVHIFCGTLLCFCFRKFLQPFALGLQTCFGSFSLSYTSIITWTKPRSKWERNNFIKQFLVFQNYTVDVISTSVTSAFQLTLYLICQF